MTRRRGGAAALLAVLAATGPAGADAGAEPEAGADAAADADGDGDIDADDRALLAAAEQIEIVDTSPGRRLVDSARAVTVIDTRVARERTADLGEVLARAQGIAVQRAGGLGAAERVSLDGLVDAQVRFFLDGVPLDLVGWGHGITNVPIELVQRIDVHRGVVPIALGADALGGAIDLVTDPSWVDRAAVSYQVGSFGTHRATALARGRDAASGAAVGLAMFVDRARNDYLIDVEIPDAQGRPQPARVRRFHDGYVATGLNAEAGVVGRGRLERALVRAFATDLAKQLQHDGLGTVPYGEAGYGESARGASADVRIADDRWSARLVAGGARRWIDFRDVAEVVYDWHGDAIHDRPRPGELGSPTDQRIRQLGGFARLIGERAVAAGGARHTVRIAIAPTWARRTGTDLLAATDTGTRDPLSARRELTQLVTGVEHDLAVPAIGLENLAFAKHYASWLDAEQLEPGFQFVPVARALSRFGAGDAARLALTARLALKASYEWALRLPSVDEAFGNGVLVRDNLELAPERSHNLNLGARYTATTGLGDVAVEATAFGRFASQLIVLLGSDTSMSYQNVFGARILGVESSARWAAPGDRVVVDGSITAQDARNVSSEGTFGAFDGDRIPSRPWLFGAAGATVRWRGVVRPGDEVAVFGQARYVHAFYRGWESLGRRETKQVVPSQLVHGAGITYAARGRTPVVVTLEVQNLTDAAAYDSYGIQRPGRAYYLKLSAEL